MKELDQGRVNQKRRTRSTILRAAAQLLSAGKTPTVAEVADAAVVSRATAYRYFPRQDLLLAEAALDLVVPDITALLATQGNDPVERIDRVVETVMRYVLAHETAFRALLRLSLEPVDAAANGSPPQRRGARRLRWAEQVLQPIADQLDTTTYRRLVAALALCMGIETIVVLRDIAELDPDAACDTARWAARHLLTSALTE
ncbi:MAG TPA: TetR family transcriptional regulator [Roseiflexaceae bacterium]|nr:TetR family transcriptional regulator [Roseiflexaceae bacterium]HMP42024.1 TetR family transcriptional regulator [Roseiflexaceae bacterium]